MNHRTDILDLRTALDVLRQTPGQLVETDVEVDPEAELSGVYRYVGAGGTVMRPTKVDGPAMVFHNVKGHPDTSVAIGVLASRQRVANLFGVKKEELGHLLCECAKNPIQPIVTHEPAPCQEVVHRATDPEFDLFKLVPAPTNTPVDAGPYITLGMCYATHPDTGCSDVTIHRMCIQSKDELSIFLQPGSRHIGAMAERATELGQPLPISVSIGVDPAIEVTACFEPPTTPLGFNELSIAGALRKRPVELCPCLTVRENAISNAEYVIEGEIVPGSNHVVEDQNSHTGYAMPEFPGYNGKARVLAAEGKSCDSPQASHHADLHRPQRGAREYGWHPHRGQYSEPHRQGIARQGAERLFSPGRRRQVYGDPAVQKDGPHR